MAKEAQSRGIEHSKIPKLKEIIKSVPGKALIFTSYRDSVDLIFSKLTEMGVSAGILIGKAWETGLKQKKQIETVQKFRDGEFDVLVATTLVKKALILQRLIKLFFMTMFLVPSVLFKDVDELEEKILENWLYLLPKILLMKHTIG